MSVDQRQFNKRLRRIVRDHQRMSYGAEHVMRDDGLIVARPRLYNPRFPLRGLVLIIGAAIGFKSFIYASLGETSYAERVTALAEGSALEKVGGWVMQADVVTVAFGQLLNGLGI